jgi:hypothetical protein
MTIGSALEAGLLVLAIVSSVAVLAIALFGSAAALERWLDGPRPLAEPMQTRIATVDRTPRAPVFDHGAHPHAA